MRSFYRIHRRQSGWRQGLAMMTMMKRLRRQRHEIACCTGIAFSPCFRAISALDSAVINSLIFVNAASITPVLLRHELPYVARHQTRQNFILDQFIFNLQYTIFLYLLAKPQNYTLPVSFLPLLYKKQSYSKGIKINGNY